MEVLTKKIDKAEADRKLNFASWGTWGCGAETFDWSYPSSSETCYILKGAADIHYEGKTTHIEAGMLVHFQKGLECTWAVSEPIEKYYKFGLNVDGLF